MSDKREMVQLNQAFFCLLFHIFLVLKLCGVITWSWWWVTAPLWGPVALVLAVLTVLVVCYVIGAILFEKGSK